MDNIFMNDFLKDSILNLNNSKFISMIEKFVLARIEQYISLHTHDYLFHNYNNIISDIERSIAHDLTQYIIKVIKYNSILFSEDYRMNIVNTAEQITYKLMPLITSQLEQHLNYLHSYSLQNNFSETTL